MLLWIYRRGDPPSVSMYATLRYRIELYRVFLSMLFSLIFLTRFKHEFKFFVKREEFFFSLSRGQRSFSRKEIGKKIYRFKNFSFDVKVSRDMKCSNISRNVIRGFMEKILE